MKSIDTSFALSGKNADFLLACSVTKTCQIQGITQAGIPGLIHLTPTLDAEFITTGEVFSLGEIAETPKGVPTPALITRAAHELRPFSTVKILDLGLHTIPSQCDVLDFGISPSHRIDEGAGIDAKVIFEKGRAFGRSYAPTGDYVILGESTPSGTTTAQASAQALGFDTQDAFASSFKDAPTSIKSTVIENALANIDAQMTNFEKLGSVSDNMLLFTAGFILEGSKRFPLVLAGGTQMAAALLVADRLSQEIKQIIEPSQLYLITTKWVAKDANSDIEKLFDQLSFKAQTFYSDFDFLKSRHPALKLYDEGEAKEGVGAGAALGYMLANSKDVHTIIDKVESYLR